jgi:hypothetical protein
MSSVAVSSDAMQTVEVCRETWLDAIQNTLRKAALNTVNWLEIQQFANVEKHLNEQVRPWSVSEDCLQRWRYRDQAPADVQQPRYLEELSCYLGIQTLMLGWMLKTFSPVHLSLTGGSIAPSQKDSYRLAWNGESLWENKEEVEAHPIYKVLRQNRAGV